MIERAIMIQNSSLMGSIFQRKVESSPFLYIKINQSFCLSLFVALMLFLSPTFALAQSQASQKVKAKFVSGDVKYQKRSAGAWKKVKVGAKISDKDRVRTFAGASLEIEFETGTTLTIEENSIVSMKELIQKGDQKNTTIDVKKGNVIFNIKKLATRKSSFKFESVTATAAIRGTSGGFGYSKSGSVVYLKTGALDLKSSTGSQYKIKPNELAVETQAGFSVRRFKSTEALDQVVEKLQEAEKNYEALSDSVEIEVPNLESLIEALPDSLQADTILTQSSPPLDTVSSVPRPIKLDSSSSPTSSEASINSYPSSVNKPELELSGTCPQGALVFVGALTAETLNSKWSLKLRWAEHEEGTKTFNAYCLLKSEKFDIGKVTVEYTRPVEEFGLKLETNTSQKVSSGVIKVKGTYSGKDTRLVLIAGTRSVELTNPSKTFDYDFLISDAARTWDLKQLTLRLKGSEGEVAEVITLEADRASKAINTYPPSVSTTLDVVKGIIRANVGNLEGDQAKVQYLIDGDLIEEFEVDNNIVGRQFKLEPGEHTYEIVTKDQAGHVAKKSLAGLSFYPRVIFQIEISSPTRAGKIRVPPMPPGREERLRELVEVRIRNLPDDNPSYLKEITIINSVANFRRVYRESQINNVSFDVDVPLKRGSKNKIIVRVQPQSGPVQEKSKEIEILR